MILFLAFSLLLIWLAPTWLLVTYAIGVTVASLFLLGCLFYGVVDEREAS